MGLWAQTRYALNKENVSHSLFEERGREMDEAQKSTSPSTTTEHFFNDDLVKGR